MMMHEQQTLKLQIKTRHQSIVQHDQLVRMTEALTSAVQPVPVIHKKVNYMWEFDTLTSSERVEWQCRIQIHLLPATDNTPW